MAYALLIESAGAMANREQFISDIDELLDEDPFLSVETWGTSSRAVKGQRAMMDLFPAPPMPPSAKQEQP